MADGAYEACLCITLHYDECTFIAWMNAGITSHHTWHDVITPWLTWIHGLCMLPSGVCHHPTLISFHLPEAYIYDLQLNLIMKTHHGQDTTLRVYVFVIYSFLNYFILCIIYFYIFFVLNYVFNLSKLLLFEFKFTYRYMWWCFLNYILVTICINLPSE